MSRDLANAISRMVRAAVRRESAWGRYTVTAVRADGRVNLDAGDGNVLLAIPCATSYTNRARGDRVAVAKTPTGWIVIGPTGAEATPTTSTPPSTTVPPTTVGAWRSGARVYSAAYPIQGGEVEPPFSGAWFYGTNLTTALHAGSTAKANLYLRRSSTPHGRVGDVWPRLYLHAHTGPPAGDLVLTGDVWTPVGLQVGEDAFVQLPAAWVTALANGTAAGIGCAAPVGDDGYLMFANCGRVAVTY